MRPLQIAAIVEGYGEVESVPILIRRIARELDPQLVVEVKRPLRVSASQLRKPEEIEKRIEFAARKLGGKGAIFVLVDCDWAEGCPARDGPELLERARKAREDVLISVVLAKKEYEAWFIAAAESLRGERRLSDSMMTPSDPENIRGAKEWLSGNMPPSHPYAETTDQPALTELFDMKMARKADSFDKCYREITNILKKLQEQD